jgi:hypothetical protein
MKAMPVMRGAGGGGPDRIFFRNNAPQANEGNKAVVED